MKKPLPPRTVLRLVRLWPHARKQGREVGQIYRVGYYCRDCGPRIVELVNSQGEYKWTADHEFIERHFQLVELSDERSLYGRNRPKLGRLRRRDIAEPDGAANGSQPFRSQ
jgi:hypothetical protein